MFILSLRTARVETDRRIADPQERPRSLVPHNAFAPHRPPQPFTQL